MIPIEESMIEVAHCPAPTSKPGGETTKVAATPTHMPATKTAAAHARESGPARNQNRAKRGQNQ
ncbi:MAG: hypothetical protein ACREC9_06830 [Methylocella sp.]